MKILLDLQCCQSGSRFGGIGRYSIELAKALILARPSYDYVVLLNDQHPQAKAEIERELAGIIPLSNVKTIHISKQSGYFNGQIYITRAMEYIREHFIKYISPDYVYIASHFEGTNDNIVSSIKKHFDIPTAVTQYDLIPYANKDFYLRDPGLRSYYLEKFGQLKSADFLFGISQYSTSEAIQLVEDFSGVATNISGGIDERFRILSQEELDIDQLRSKFNIDGAFLLYTASFDSRKNHKKLIEAYSLLSEDIKERCQLVIVGNGWSGVYDELHAFAEAVGVDRSRIIFTGRVDDDELVRFYNACELFVFPPLWEGLGLPVLEAMACGAPVVASCLTSIPEVLGMAEAEFDPLVPESIAQKVTMALTDEEFQSRMRAHAAIHSKLFTWQRSAEVVLAQLERSRSSITNRIQRALSPKAAIAEGGYLESARRGLANFLGNRSLPQDVSHELDRCLVLNSIELGENGARARKVGWLSTWNTRCGIATYSQNLFPFISQDKVVLAPYRFDTLEDDQDYVYRCWEQSKSGQFHDLDATIDRTGVTDVVVQFNFGFFDVERFTKFVEGCVRRGIKVYITMHSTTNPPPEYKDRLEHLERVFVLSSAIFVHTESDVKRLAEIGVTINVRRVPHFIYAHNESQKLTKSPVDLIASYGFFLPHKGIDVLVEAMSIVVKSRPRAKLRLVNADYGDSLGVSAGEIVKCKQLAVELGIAGSVEFETQYLTDMEAFQLLRDAKLTVFPYQKTGESSSGAVRMAIASGNHFAVTPLEIFDDVKQLAFVLPGGSSEEVAHGILNALDEIDAGTSGALAKAEAAARVRKLSAASTIATHIDTVVSVSSVADGWEKAVEPSVPEIPLIAGRYRGGRIVCSDAGLVCYGPYARLDPGSYRLLVRGACSSSGPSALKLSLKSDNGSRVLRSWIVNRSSDGIILEEFLSLSSQQHQVELQIEALPGARLSLEGYEFDRMTSSYLKPEHQAVLARVGCQLDLASDLALLLADSTDQAMLENAYNFLLRRAPDANEYGFQHQISRLRAGVSRLTVIKDIMSSDEFFYRNPSWLKDGGLDGVDLLTL